jgi:diguanylate cyclase (GGDEF)-like protein
MTDALAPGSATILVVDDDAHNRKLLEALLAAQGYRTATAASGELALELITADPPDLVLLDVMMPGMDGYQVAVALKSDARTSNIPIIMLSALSDRDARVRGLNAGAEDFLTKPVDRSELWPRVRNLLRLKELSDRLEGQNAVLEAQVEARTADLHQLAHYDALTCVPNRAYLYKTLERTLPVAAANGWAVAVMFVDIDHFKSVNDTLGHAAGDSLLTQFTGRLVESVRVRDTVGRLGGDEFAVVVLLKANHQDAAAVVAANILAAIQAPFQIQGLDVHVSASIGIAVYPDDASDADTLLHNADTAMYRAKETGRNAFRFFTAIMTEQAAARLEVEAASRKRAESMGLLAHNLLDDMDAPTCSLDDAGVITAVNRAWRAVTATAEAIPAGVAVGASYVDALASHHDGDGAALRTGIRQLLAGVIERFDFTYSRRDGDQQRWYTLDAFAMPDHAGAVMSHRDITTAHRAQAGLAMRHTEDALTGLPDRDRLLTVLTEALASGDPLNATLAVACVGIDGLTNINDCHGYAAGDEVLQRVAKRLAHELRGGGSVYRFASDEFAVIWPCVPSQAEASELAQSLATALACPFEVSGATATVSASIGVALVGVAQSGEEVLHAAEGAMRDAKRLGPGRTFVYMSPGPDTGPSRVQLEAEIRAGLARDEFVLHYQPIVDIQRGTVTGVEALVRWNHPDGLRMPDSFIPIAERSGLIVPLGAWVLEEACRQAAAWSADGLDLTMAVNLSVRQVADPGLVALVANSLRTTGLAPERLILEITESAVIEDAELALAALVSLRALGTGIAIDDFGTGYSSLLYLKRYPIHTLKIDRAFVSGMGVHANDDAIVASIVSLARAVNAVCIAEGVETLEQAAALRVLGCDQAQGYLYARPTPGHAVPDAVADCERALQTPILVRIGRTGARHAVVSSVLRRMEELHQRGASPHTIAAALNAESAGPGGVRWSSSSVRGVLTAKAAGVVMPPRDCVPSAHGTQASSD